MACHSQKRQLWQNRAKVTLQCFTAMRHIKSSSQGHFFFFLYHVGFYKCWRLAIHFTRQRTFPIKIVHRVSCHYRNETQLLSSLTFLIFTALWFQIARQQEVTKKCADVVESLKVWDEKCLVWNFSIAKKTLGALRKAVPVRLQSKGLSNCTWKMGHCWDILSLYWNSGF